MAEGKQQQSTYKGWLYKWKNYLQRYQKRYFVLQNGLLSYYMYRDQAEMTDTCRRTINLATAFIHIADSCTIVISSGENHTLHLKTTTEVDIQEWITALELAQADAVRMLEPDPNLPPEILRMDSRSRDLYLKALGEGKTEVHNIRVMVVGHSDVGKTTLTKRLLEKEVNISDRNSTEGIDVHVKRCWVALETGLWEVKSKDLHKDDSLARLAKVVQQVCSTERAISNTDSSLDVASNYYAGNLVATHDGLNEPDLHKYDTCARFCKDEQQVCFTGLAISDTDSSLDVASINYAGKLVATPDDANHFSFDEEHGDSSSNSEGAGTSMSASLPSQIDPLVMDEITKLLDNSEDLSDINKYADVSIWDFAGQYAFYGTHQLFLSHRSVYLLVIDLSKTFDSLVCDDTCYKDTDDGENRMRISEFVEFWLQSIHFHTGEEGMVILVGTHADKLAQEDRKENVIKFFKGLRTRLSKKPYFVCLSEHEFDIDNNMVDPNLKKLKEAIFNVAKSNTSHWGELKPAKWLTLERRLHEMRQKEVKIIERDELGEENKSLCVPLTEEELDLFLRFQHACGLLLYFSEQELKDYVILDPQWLIDAFKCFITEDVFKQKNTKMLPLWNSFKENAILTQEFIDLLWSTGGMFSSHKKHLLRLMEKLNIIAKLVAYGENEITDLRVSWISEGSYFTPCMLKQKTPSSLLYTKQIPNSNCTPRLCYTFVPELDSKAPGVVPPAIFHRLIAACMSKWQPRETEEKNETKTLLFCDSGVFDLDHSRIHTLTLYLCNNFIQMWVTSYSQNQPNDNIKTREQVECFLQKLYSNSSKMAMKTCIKCPSTDCCSSDGMIELSLLSNNQEYCCPWHEEGSKDQNHLIQSKEVLRNWTVVDRTKVEDTFSDRIPTDAEIAIMAGRIGKEWQQLGRVLNLSQPCLDRIEMDNPNKSADKISKMLIEWRKMSANGATFQTLESALKSSDCDVSVVFKNF